MNRVDRLFAILLLLQARRQIRAQDIADQFEISERTVYRDMSALQQMGIPIVAQAGEGYSLMDGYFLPPLIFTEAEARAVFLGTSMLRATGNTSQAADSALDKLTAALPARLRQQVEQQVSIIQFYLPKTRFDLSDSRLTLLQDAILHQRVIRLRYFSRNTQAASERMVEPHELTYSGEAWYLSGYCRMRADKRSFRLDRIESVALTDEVFERLPDDSSTLPPTIDISVRFDAHVRRWVQERQHYACVDFSADGVARYQVHHMDEIKNWLLGWGASAEILSPQALRDEIRAEAEKLVSLLT